MIQLNRFEALLASDAFNAEQPTNFLDTAEIILNHWEHSKYTETVNYQQLKNKLKSADDEDIFMLCYRIKYYLENMDNTSDEDLILSKSQLLEVIDHKEEGGNLSWTFESILIDLMSTDEYEDDFQRYKFRFLEKLDYLIHLCKEANEIALVAIASHISDKLKQGSNPKKYVDICMIIAAYLEKNIYQNI